MPVRDFLSPISKAISIPSENSAALSLARWRRGMAARGKTRLRPSEHSPFERSDRQFRSCWKNSQSSAFAGQLARRGAEKLKLRQDVFLAELQLDPVSRRCVARKNRGAMSRCPDSRASSAIFATSCGRYEVFRRDENNQSLGIVEITSIEAAESFSWQECSRQEILAARARDFIRAAKQR